MTRSRPTNGTAPGPDARTAASKAIAILLVMVNGGEFTLSEIARLAGLPLSTTYRVVGEMHCADVLSREQSGRYRIGSKLKAVRTDEPPAPTTKHETARRVMEDLVAVYPWASVRLGVLAGRGVSYIEKTSPNRPVSIAFERSVLPAHATAIGKVLLAFGEPAAADRIIAAGLHRFTPYTTTSPDQLRRSLASIRRTGSALVRWELDLATCAVAVPIVAAGESVAAIELVAGQPENLHRATPGLHLAARILGRCFQDGHRPGTLVIHPEGQLDVLLFLHRR